MSGIADRERLAALLEAAMEAGAEQMCADHDHAPVPILYCEHGPAFLADAVLADRALRGHVVEQVAPAPFVIEGDSDEELADLRAQRDEALALHAGRESSWGQVYAKALRRAEQAEARAEALRVALMDVADALSCSKHPPHGHPERALEAAREALLAPAPPEP